MAKGRKNYQTIPDIPSVDLIIDVGGGGGCSGLLSIFSYIFVVLFFPFSLFYSIKVSCFFAEQKSLNLHGSSFACLIVLPKNLHLRLCFVLHRTIFCCSNLFPNEYFIYRL